MEKVHYVGTTSQTYADDKLFTYVLHNKEYVLHTLLSVTREIHYHLKISLDVSILIFSQHREHSVQFSNVLFIPA